MQRRRPRRHGFAIVMQLWPYLKQIKIFAVPGGKWEGKSRSRGE
jgi:hypothetical protein